MRHSRFAAAVPSGFPEGDCQLQCKLRALGFDIGSSKWKLDALILADRIPKHHPLLRIIRCLPGEEPGIAVSGGGGKDALNRLAAFKIGRRAVNFTDDTFFA